MTEPALEYTYRAVRLDGAVEDGILSAPGRERASAILRERGLFPMQIEVDGPGRQKRLSSVDLAQGLGILATLLEAALPLSRALASMEELIPKSWTSLLTHLRESVRDGNSLSSALTSGPVEVPPVVIGIVHAGEQGSDLAAAVRRAASLLEARAAARSTLVSSLIYPLTLAITGAASVALLVGVVIPRFAEILADLGQSLPSTTRLVLQSAAYTRALALPAAVALLVGFALWRTWVSSEKGREQWADFVLGLPLVGALRFSIGSARCAGTLAALLDSGVPISPALLRAADASGDFALRGRLLAARQSVIAGTRLSAALQAESAFTPTAIRLVRTGEESGRLAHMLGHASRIENERAERIVKAAVRLVEPALIIVFGGIVALVAAALLQAVYAVRP